MHDLAVPVLLIWLSVPWLISLLSSWRRKRSSRCIQLFVPTHLSQARLRQYVYKMTTIIAYNTGIALSSENHAVVQFEVLAASRIGKWRRKVGGVRPTLLLTWV